MITRRNITGFTLFDLMIAITIMAVMAVVLFPRLKDDSQLRVRAASRLLTSDIEVAQVMTISRPQDPVVVRFEPAQGKYWLARASDPATPIIRPGSGYVYVVEFGTARARMAPGVLVQLTDLAADTLTFNAQGGLDDLGTTPSIRLFLGTQWIDLTIAPTTGTISETMGED